MRLKSFQAKSMNDALRQVRDTLGEDAIIVSSREESGGWVHVTAAVEQLRQEIAPQPQPAYDEDAVIDAVTEAMLKHRVPAGVSDRIISAAADGMAASPQAALAQALKRSFSFAPLHEGAARPIALVGPPGAGKTLMTAKIAAECVLSGRRPAVITTDIARAGGVEQLQAFLDILALPLQQARDAKSLKAALGGAASAPLTIIDTGGLNPFDAKEMKDLARLLAAGDMDPVLVLPAGTDAEESAEIAMTFALLGVKKIAATRLDFARRLGGILSAAERAGLAFADGSHTPQVANGLLRLAPDSLAALLMPKNPATGGRT